VTPVTKNAALPENGNCHDVILNGGEAGVKDPTKAPSTSTASGTESEAVDLTGVLKAIDNFEAAGKKLNDSLIQKLSSNQIDHQQSGTLNRGMMQLERNWLNPDGIPGRPWFKHILYGARFTYAHLELPGLTEAVEKQDWPTAKQQAAILDQAIRKNTQLLEDLSQALTPRN
jgi:N-acetylated-alpha-linked acidic dipeptidase